MRGATDKMTGWALVLSWTVLIAVSWLAVRTIQSMRQAGDQVVRTQDVLGRLERLRFDLKAAEAAGRGSVLAPQNDFSATVNSSRRAAMDNLATLRTQVGDDPQQRARLDALEPLLTQRFSRVEELLRLRFEGGERGGDSLEGVLEEGLRLTSQVLFIVDAMARHEKALLSAREERAERRLRWVYAVIGGGLVLSIGLTTWPIYRLRGELRERVLMQRKLIESSARVHDLYNNAPCGYLSADSTGRVVAMNQTLIDWLRLDRAGLSRLTLEDLCAPETRRSIATWLRGLDTGSVLREREADFLRADDGHRIPVWLSAVRAGGKEDALRVTVVDITERKRAETAVERARDQAESIVDTVRQPLVVLTEDLHVASANRAFRSAFVRDGGEIVGRRFADIDGGEWARPELLRALEDVVPKQLTVDNFELSLNSVERGRQLLRINARKLYRAGNHTSMTLMSIEDVTERHLMDEVHRQFRALFESLPGRYLVLAPDFTIVAASDAYLAATMTSREQIVGRDLFAVFPDNPDDTTATGTSNLRASLGRVLATGAADTMPVQRYDVRGADGTFEERHWSPVNSPVLGADKKIEYIIHRVEDVTVFVLGKAETGEASARMVADVQREQLAAEMLVHSQALGAANQQLHALNEELESFSYSISHDLRAPLRHIAGFAEMLAAHAEGSLDDKGRRYLDTITESAGRMGQLIDDLLMFSRTGRSELRRQDVRLDELVAAVREGLKGDLDGRSVDWAVGSLPVVQGDASMLRQVFVNLLGNAVKYTRGQPQARIAISSHVVERDEVEVLIEDNGAGFDMKYAPKLFGVFQRLHSAAEFEGTGVGLAIVRRILQRHGGQIRAESEGPGKGARFYFTLPASAGGQPLES
jgi:PAS domain S-box-containing protein